MKHFYIITNEQKDKELALTKAIVAYIREKGCSCRFGLNVRTGAGEYPDFCAGEYPGFCAGEYPGFCAGELPKDTECVICVGGDGTMLRAARDLVETGLPVIGVNRGHVGYLCELDSETVYAAIDELIGDRYVVENRMLLSGYCVKQGERTPSGQALNDIVIHRSGFQQVVNFIISVNGEYLNTYSADGVIVATPTGSTAYSMSAGGPIVDPRAELLLITPICPHALNSKSIVLGAEDEIEVEIGARSQEEAEAVEVSFDGDQVIQLAVGDKIVIRRARARTRILKLNKRSFLEILRKKMGTYS